jgi:phosphate transport system permease protein
VGHRPAEEAVRIELRTLDPRRRRKDRLARAALAASMGLTVLVLVGLLGVLAMRGLPAIDLAFLTNYPSRFPHRAGVLPAILGTVWIGVASMAFALPVGIAAAVYLHEFAPANRVTSFLRSSISNLAGVPSVVFGLLGLALFVRAMALGTSIFAAGLTLGILTLPIVVVAAEEALKTVPRSMREAALALGASRWQAVRHHVLPYALGGMLTGSILALSRAVGETAPLILIGAATYISFLPEGPFDSYSALPIQAYYWAQQPSPEFHTLAWAAVLLLVVLTFLANLAAIVLRDRFQARYRW